MKELIILTAVCLLGLIFYGSSRSVGSANEEKGAMTFTKQISPIFQNRCEECHHQGGVAPMSLATYEEVRPWARAIREKVTEKPDLSLLSMKCG